MEFVINVFTEFIEYSDKKLFVIKRAGTYYLLCKRQVCYHSESKTHVRDITFNPNSCFTDLSDSLKSLNSKKGLLNLGKTPINAYTLLLGC